ncbi:MAG: hypothetical protein PHV03_05440 [Desulfitobacteriaceae bacterium]|nr:hypothetical protein [Desulfitobacteriaceae bacterium]
MSYRLKGRFFIAFFVRNDSIMLNNKSSFASNNPDFVINIFHDTKYSNCLAESSVSEAELKNKVESCLNFMTATDSLLHFVEGIIFI